MKKVLLFFISFLFILNVNAYDLKDIQMDIYVKPNGDADIVEKWSLDSHEGTEVYKTYNNLGSSEIKDFKVFLDSKEYTNIGTWNLDATFEQKAYKNGINYIDDGLELCFGLSSYGTHTYTLTYTITNFILELSDSQMAYWTLIPRNLGDSVEKIYIKIHSDFEYEDTLDVWGYGQGGAPVYVYDGYIEMSNDHALTSDEYMTVLIKYPLGSFTTQNKGEVDFNYYLDMAEKDAIHYENGTKLDRIGSAIMGIFSVLFTIGLPILIIISTINSSAKTAKYMRSTKRLPKDINYFRDIPKDNIFTSFYISNLYNLVNKKTDLFGSILLRWLKEGYITIEQTKKTGLFKKEEIITSIKLGEVKCESSYEATLYGYIRSAAKDNLLEEDEFKKWAKNNYSKLLNWFDNINRDEYNKFLNDGTITKTIKSGFIKTAVFEEKDIVYDKALQLGGLKKYLEDFSSLDEKRTIEVHLWEDYLIYAQMFGIAKKVAEELKKMYPELVDQMQFDYSDIILLNSLSSNVVAAAETARSRAESYSSGGGGFSSSGGGGGSFGGGSGGGGVR